MFTPRFKAGQRVAVKVYKRKDKLICHNVDTSISQASYKSGADDSSLVRVFGVLVPSGFEEPHFDSSDNTYRMLAIPNVYHSDSKTLLTEISQGYFWVHDAFMEPCHGMACCECHNGYEYGEPNFQEDKLVCWPCVDSMGWKYQRINGKVTLK